MPAKQKKQLPPPPPVEEEEIEEFDEEFEDDEEGDFEEGSQEFAEGDDEEDSDIDFDDVDSDEDDASSINEDDDFEVKAAKYKKKMMMQAQLAHLESADQRAGEAKATPLADMELHGDEIMKGLGSQLTAEELDDRIKETIRVLSNFKVEREEGRSREEYLTLLRSDFMETFEYNEYMMDVIMDMFPPQEAYEFMNAMEKPRPTTIRTNTIKSKRRDLVEVLTKRGVNVEPLEKWSKVGLQVFESNVPIAGTVEYLAGHYMLQSAVSFLPVMALAPQEDERVLDMAAAPGGKTTYIAQLMKNSGVLFANDVSEPRIKSLNANIQRLGVTNCIVTNYDGIGYSQIMSNFDRILLDAPCTGSGIISRDKSIKTSKSLADVQRASQLQRKLLLSAIDACKPGGYVVYSTCSFLVDENEAVADYAIRRRHVQCVEMGLPFGRPGYTKYRHLRLHASVANTRRFFPHVHNMDGFYVCKFRKLKNGPVEGNDEDEEPVSKDAKKAAQQKQDPKAATAKKQAPAPKAAVVKPQPKVATGAKRPREEEAPTPETTKAAFKLSAPPKAAPKKKKAPTSAKAEAQPVIQNTKKQAKKAQKK